LSFAERFEVAVGDALKAEVSSVAIEGGRRFYLERGDCSAKFDLYKDHINWVSISSPGGEGWLGDAVKFVKTVAPKHNVKYVLANPATDDARGALEHFGFKRDGNKLRLKV
jgi:hypothetical protein